MYIKLVLRRLSLTDPFTGSSAICDASEARPSNDSIIMCTVGDTTRFCMDGVSIELTLNYSLDGNAHDIVYRSP